MRVGPTNAERREESVKILKVGDGLTGENEVGSFHCFVVCLLMKIVKRVAHTTARLNLPVNELDNGNPSIARFSSHAE